MLYLTLPDMDLLAEQPTDYNFESFTPSDDTLREGWVMFGVYTHYDSERHDPEKYYQVFDFYSNRDAAMTAAKTLHDNEKNWELRHVDTVNRPKAYYADGREIKNIAFVGWGSSLVEMVVKRCKVQDHQDLVRFH